MCKLRRIDIEQSERIFEKIDLYVQRLVEKLNPQAVVLFGSFARGDINESSDVDILVIANFKEPFLERIKLLLQLNDDLKLPLEPVGYTPEECQRMRAEGNRFVEEVLRTGKVLFGEIPALSSYKVKHGMDLARERRRYIEKLEESVKQLRETLSSLPEVERVILFGSYACGRRDLLTDLDVLVVMRTELPFLERQRFLYQRLALPVDADILCYTPEEFEALKDSPFWTNALKEGFVLYEKKTA